MAASAMAGGRSGTVAWLDTLGRIYTGAGVSGVSEYSISRACSSSELRQLLQQHGIRTAASAKKPALVSETRRQRCGNVGAMHHNPPLQVSLVFKMLANGRIRSGAASTGPASAMPLVSATSFAHGSGGALLATPGSSTQRSAPLHSQLLRGSLHAASLATAALNRPATGLDPGHSEGSAVSALSGLAPPTPLPVPATTAAAAGAASGGSLDSVSLSSWSSAEAPARSARSSGSCAGSARHTTSVRPSQRRQVDRVFPLARSSALQHMGVQAAPQRTTVAVQASTEAQRALPFHVGVQTSPVANFRLGNIDQPAVTASLGDVNSEEDSESQDLMPPDAGTDAAAAAALGPPWGDMLSVSTASPAKQPAPVQVAVAPQPLPKPAPSYAAAVAPVPPAARLAADLDGSDTEEISEASVPPGPPPAVRGGGQSLRAVAALLPGLPWTQWQDSVLQ